MDTNIKKRLEQDLNVAVSRLRQIGGPWPSTNCPGRSGQFPLCRRGGRDPGQREP